MLMVTLPGTLLILTVSTLICLRSVYCILNNQWINNYNKRPYDGVADDPAYGCRWLQSELNCNCQNVDKVSD